MNPTTIENENPSQQIFPGAYLAAEREKKGISLEQIATKLNLRVQVLSYLEADQYDQLPQPVFVQGYIRAYCKYLGISPDIAIEAFIAVKPPEHRSDKFLWQNQEHPNKNERWLYWMTLAFIVVSVISVSMWIYENKTNSVPMSSRMKTHPQPEALSTQVDEDKSVKLSDLNKVKNLLSTVKQENFSPRDME